jgi:hypothetical protein
MANMTNPNCFAAIQPPLEIHSVPGTITLETGFEVRSRECKATYTYICVSEYRLHAKPFPISADFFSLGDLDLGSPLKSCGRGPLRGVVNPPPWGVGRASQPAGDGEGTCQLAPSVSRLYPCGALCGGEPRRDPGPSLAVAPRHTRRASGTGKQAPTNSRTTPRRWTTSGASTTDKTGARAHAVRFPALGGSQDLSKGVGHFRKPRPIGSLQIRRSTSSAAHRPLICL